MIQVLDLDFLNFILSRFVRLRFFNDILFGTVFDLKVTSGFGRDDPTNERN